MDPGFVGLAVSSLDHWRRRLFVDITDMSLTHCWALGWEGPYHQLSQVNKSTTSQQDPPRHLGIYVYICIPPTSRRVFTRPLLLCSTTYTYTYTHTHTHTHIPARVSQATENHKSFNASISHHCRPFAVVGSCPTSSCPSYFDSSSSPCFSCLCSATLSTEKRSTSHQKKSFVSSFAISAIYPPWPTISSGII